MQVAVNYAPSSNTPDPTASSAPGGSIRLYRGFGGKCVDAKGNSSANRTKVIIWGTSPPAFLKPAPQLP